jgi:hypothetical protein
MTVLQPASWHDVVFLEDFLEDARADFDLIPAGVPISTVDVVFCRWRGFAYEGMFDPDWPADFSSLFCWVARTRGRFAFIAGSSVSCCACGRMQLRVACVP